MVHPRTKVRRHLERALTVPADAESNLQRAMVAHVGIVEDGWPVVIPMTYHYQDGHVYIHGAPGSRLIKALAAGAPACVEVTLLDGLIASKPAETHSINYRSVVLFGRGALVRNRERRRVPCSCRQLSRSALPPGAWVHRSRSAGGSGS